MNHDGELDRLHQVWKTLGTEDPLWAVNSRPDKRGGRWELADFLRTGEEDVARCATLLQRRAGAPTRFAHVLDFGCGVGRLVRAWSQRADSVTGVDISETMLEQGRRILADRPNTELVHNPRPDLACFQDERFDLVFSLICLQHIPWALAARYVTEFGRVCRPGGWVAFQLPTRVLGGAGIASLRQRIVEGLPFGLGARYRAWRHGSSAVFDVHFTPPERVEEAARAGGLDPITREPDGSAGANTEGFFYIFRKP
jgi:SAM-dependent methyltransferase